MKRVCLFIMVMFSLVSFDSAFAAKARLISSKADSEYHTHHLAQHVGSISCFATGNYIKVRSQPDQENVIGHLEQADSFKLLEIKNGYALICVTDPHKTSPDSWSGMTGWVNPDYIDCYCNTSAYFSENDSVSLAYYPSILPNGWSFSSGAGAWSTELRINSDGTFYGYYHDADASILYESYFTGRFSNIHKTDSHTYSMTVSELQVNGIIDYSYYQNDTLHIITESYGIKQGDVFFAHTPGTEKSQLSEEHLSWLHGIITDPLSNFALCNMTQGYSFDPYSEHPEQLRFDIGSTTNDFQCNATNLRVRNAPNGPQILGHLESDDSFIVNAVVDDWAHILVTHAADTSPDSFVGLSGWVNTEYISKRESSDYSWKSAYLDYLEDTELLRNTEDTSVFWLVYINDDTIPELIIDTQIIAGGAYALTYHQGNVDSICIGTTGIPSYIERGNLILDSAGHQGCYYDAVYTITNGKWDEIYYAENHMHPSLDTDTYQEIAHTYYINGCEVTEHEYYTTLYSYYNTSKSTKLIYGNSVRYLNDVLR